MKLWNTFKAWLEKYIVPLSVGIGIGSLLFILIGYGVTGHLFKNDFDHDYLSAFGDFLSGFLGAVFGMITIYLVYKTFKSQKEELNDQKKLLVDQQAELRLTRASQERQNFENTFFNLLSHNRQLHKQIDIDYSKNLTLIPFRVKRIATDFLKLYKKNKSDINLSKNTLSEILSRSILIKEYSLLNHYVSSTIQIATYINNSNFDNNLKNMYSLILENNLGHFEKLLFLLLKTSADANLDFGTVSLKEDLKDMGGILNFMKTKDKDFFSQLENTAWSQHELTVF